ncbi:MAG: hypothetical protein ABWZ40_00315 [Caulobacterales bacterium]
MASLSRKAAATATATVFPSCASLRQVPAAAAFVDRDGRVLHANPSFYCVLKNAHAGQKDWLDAFEPSGLEIVLCLIGAIEDSHGAASVRLRRRADALPVWCVVSSGSGEGAVRLVTLHYAPDAANLYSSLIDAHNFVRESDFHHSTLQMHIAAIVVDACSEREPVH